ncbi:hypothetical protein FRC01_007451 [Tulasnella sp. 417]|nr:hypothetical protein FRC01_007451 [Tulasnella sp. 417]
MPRIGKPTDLLNRVLRLSLGSEVASRELRWMKEAIYEARPKISPADFEETLKSYVKRRAAGIPLAYVLGTQPFGPLTIKCRPPTLIPRPETEDWVTRLGQVISSTQSGSKSPISVLDICTGSGCIPLLLSSTSRSPIAALGVDISEAAVKLAKENVSEAGLSDRIPIVRGDLFDNDFVQTVLARSASPEALGFDVITSNPPYIPQEEYDKLAPSVKQYEDRLALLGDREGSEEADGLSFYHRIVELISKENLIRDGGILAVEHGLGQSAAVQRIISNALGRRIRRLEAWKDQWEKERAVVAFL